MSRPIVLGVAALLLFALGFLAANTHVARGVIFPVTAYEADVNKDTRVNVADLGLVASKYGQIAPTATLVPSATATPTSYCNLSGRSFLPFGHLDRLGGGTYGPPYGPGDGLNDCRFVGAAFSGANFSFSSLRNADFTNATFGACYCSWADFSGATFAGASIDVLDAPNASFQNANLSGLEFGNMIATGATFAGANLTNMVLASDYLSAFEGADFTGAITAGADASGVVYWGPNTICPDGTNSDDDGGSCIGHGFAGTPLATWTPTATPTATATPTETPTATATPIPCVGGAANAVWTAGNGHCYQRFNDAINFVGAQNECSLLGEYLVSLTSQAEQDFVWSSLGVFRAWIGYSDAVLEGQWEWLSGEPSAFTNWGPGEPNNSLGIENYAQFNGDGTWNDNTIAAVEQYICEHS